MSAKKVLKIGAPDWSEMFVISQIFPKDPNGKAQFSLPGDVVCIGNFFSVGIIPSVRIVIPGNEGPEWLAAVISLAEHSTELTEETLGPWEMEVDARPAPAQFEILVDCGEMTYSELVTGAHMDLLTLESPAWVSMQFALHYEDMKSPLTSEPVKALMASLSVDKVPDPPTVAPDCFDIFDCHSHWFREPLKKKNRRWFTKCCGPCPPGLRCTCGTPPARRCWGLHFCWC